MKKFAKKMQQVVALSVVAVALVGCSSDSDTAKESDTTTEEPAVTQEEVAEPEAEGYFTDAKWPAKDMGGRVITAANTWQNFPLNGEPYDPSVNNETDKMMYDNWLRLQEKYNVTYTGVITTWEELLPKFQTSVLAGEPYTDLTWLQGTDSFAAALNGQLLPISSFTDPSDDIWTTQKYVKPALLVNGEYYGMEQVNVPMEAEFLGYNVRLINELGLEDPQELYARGEWNWDKFLEYAKAGTFDKDGDGTNDVYGIAGPTNNIFNGFIASNNGYWVNADFELGVTDEKTQKAIQFAGDLWNKENVAFVPETGIWDWDGNVNAFKSDNILFWWGAAWLHSASELESLDYGMVPFPTGPDTDESYWFSPIEGGSATMYMPTGVKNPEDVYQVYAEYWSWFEDSEVANEGTMSWLESCFKRQEDVDLLVEYSTNNRKYDAYGVITGLDVGAVMGPVALGEKTVAQSVEENKQRMQDAVTTSTTPK